MDKSTFFSSLGAYLKANRAFFLSVLFILIATGGYFWWQAGYSLDFMRFFAANGPQIVFNNGSNFGHGDSVSISWSKTDATECHSDNGWVDTGGSVEGTANSPAIDACGASSGTVRITCTGPGGSGFTDKRFTIDTSTCPGAARCGNGTCEPPTENASSCPADCAAPPPPTYTCQNTSGQQCIGVSCGTAGMSAGSGTCPSGQNCCRPPTTSAPTATISASPNTVPPGGTVTLTWSSTNATSCTVTSGNFGPINTSGTATEAIGLQVPSGSTVGFNIRCTGPGGTTTSNTASVTVQGGPVLQHYECRNNSCTLIPETGTNDPGCSAVGQSCTTPTHAACVNNACVEVPGQGSDQCTTDAQCASSTACPCGAGGWFGIDLPSIKACKIGGNIDTSQRCTTLSPGTQASARIALCNNSSQTIYSRERLFYSETQTCGAHDQNPGHSNFSGPSEVGPGEVAILEYSFNVGGCGSWQLDDNWGPGHAIDTMSNVINTGVNCAPSQHLACRNNACTLVAGGGGNEDGCTSAGQSCGTSPQNHNVCSNMACVSVAGAGANECSADGDCWKLSCVNNACARVAGTGPNTDGCTAENTSCGSTPTHTVCQNNACVSVAGVGTNECTSDANCAPASHMICQNNACVSVSGAGTNECSTAADCQTTRELSCAALQSQVNIGQPAQFTATGFGTFTWYAPGGLSTSNTGTPFSVTYATPGFKTVTVVSGGEQASCTVTVLSAVTSSPPPTSLLCAPEKSEAISGQEVDFTASGGSQTCDGRNTYQWSTNPNGTPATGQGCNFSSVFTLANDVETQNFVATVTDGEESASCEVAVSCPIAECPAPPEDCTYQGGNRCSCGELVCPSNAPLVCAPVSQTVNIGQRARFDAAGGTSRTYSWTATDGDPSSQTGPGASFETEYDEAGDYTVTVSAGGQSAQCRVTVRETDRDTHLECRNRTCTRVNGSGSNECSPVGSSCGGGSGGSYGLTLEKLVRNVTTSSQVQEAVTANPGNTVEFSLRVESTGSATVRSVTVRDALPAGLSYLPGSTTIDGVAAADGITSTGLNIGDMPRGRTITVRFRATVVSESFFSRGTTVLTNTGYARGDYAPEVSDVAFVTVSNAQNVSLSLTKTGRNTTRGETSDTSPVRSSPAQTLQFSLRVRNMTLAAINNVMIRDVLPPAITLVPGSVRIGTTAAADSLTAAGLSLGTMAPGQEITVTFSGLVASATSLPTGTTTVINTVTVSATGVPTISAQLPIIISNGGTFIPPVDAGPGETTVLALIISAIITLLYVGYTSTETYRRHEAGAIAKESRGGMSDFK